MKSLTGLNILVGIILMLGVAVTANKIIWGYVLPNERILVNISVVKPGRWFGAHEVYVSYPTEGNFYPVTLSRIEVKDWGGRKNFGYAELTSGGPGEGYATIFLKSQSRQLLNFTIQFFGLKY